QQVMPTRSYLSQVELPVTFGLGESDQIDKIVIHWADGQLQEIAPPAVDQTLVIERSTDS
ncbi:MAG: ASPIC/UnbV domain-containing protein, partial [Planctomycetaceae bacterium]|nr:ASPIC/UnbV domain-containing protein [Planctomycetaceae bacterium]